MTEFIVQPGQPDREGETEIESSIGLLVPTLSIPLPVLNSRIHPSPPKDSIECQWRTRWTRQTTTLLERVVGRGDVLMSHLGHRRLTGLNTH